MKLILLVSAFFPSLVFGSGENSQDPYAKFNGIVDNLRAEERRCETRLLPVPVIGNMETAAGRITAAIGDLAVGEYLLLNDPDMLAGRQKQWLSLLQTVGLRVLGMRSVDGFARTQVMVQKAEPAEGVLTRINNLIPLTEPKKFTLKYFKNRRTRQKYEMIELEGKVFAFPFYIEDRRLKVLLRPQVPGVPIVETLNEVAGTNYLPQPVQMALDSDEIAVRKVMSLMRTVVPRNLAYRARRSENVYYSSPDSVLSPVQSVFVPLKAPHTARVFDWEVWDVETLMPRLEETAAGDGVLELNLHLLMQEQLIPPARWLGEPLNFTNHDRRTSSPPALELAHVRTWRRSRWFLPEASAKWRFVSADVQEVNAQGVQTALSQTEFAISREGSSNIVSLLPVQKINGVLWIGLMPADSPAPQVHGESSLYWSLPVWRVFNGESSLEAAVKDASGLFERRFDMKVNSVQSLGASFRPDPEMSSDLVYPFVVEVDRGSREPEGLTWFPLETILPKIKSLRDARLMISLFRLSQAPKN